MMRLICLLIVLLIGVTGVYAAGDTESMTGDAEAGRKKLSHVRLVMEQMETVQILHGQNYLARVSDT